MRRQCTRVRHGRRYRGETGWLEPDDVESFARRIAAVAQMPDDALDRVARAARARAEKFRWDEFVDRIDEHVDEMAGRRATTVSA
jgi:glycosyltransferase involved in cell wall biosynthesis